MRDCSVPTCALTELIDVIKTRPRKQQTLLIGIDGCGASGKSTFAQAITTNHPDTTIVHMDDFYRPSRERLPEHLIANLIGPDFDWLRLHDQVITPLSRDREASYQKYDWDQDAMADWRSLPVGGTIIIEGIYSTRHELAPYYDFTCWIDCPRDLRLERGLARDGENARMRWEKYWMPAEDRYVELHKPDQRADAHFNGSLANNLVLFREVSRSNSSK